MSDFEHTTSNSESLKLDSAKSSLSSASLVTWMAVFLIFLFLHFIILLEWLLAKRDGLRPPEGRGKGIEF